VDRCSVWRAPVLELTFFPDSDRRHLFPRRRGRPVRHHRRNR
jgi:hypothetical protein